VSADTCKYCPYEFTDDTLATIDHLRTHADIFAEQGLAERKLADLDHWERNHRRFQELLAEWPAKVAEMRRQLADGTQ
jgi:hypothetical protein